MNYNNKDQSKMLFYLDIFGCFMCFLEDRISMTLTSLIFRLSCLSGEESPRGRGKSFDDLSVICISAY